MTEPRNHQRPPPAEAPRVLVVGTGPAGLVAALALACSGLAVTLAGPVSAPGGTPDQRTTALFGGSVELLRHLAVWPWLDGKVAALSGLRLIDDTAAPRGDNNA